MKFVIKSLLFVNLILQMTSSLRKCFSQDQNLMITIILIAFSVIGLIGLIIGNRFILIIFSACMTLILIASITIYAIGSTEQDPMQPKVPYYSSIPVDLGRQTSRAGEIGRQGKLGSKESQSKLKSLVNRVLGRNPSKSKTQSGHSSSNRTDLSWRSIQSKSTIFNGHMNPNVQDDSDESVGISELPLSPMSRSTLEQQQRPSLTTTQGTNSESSTKTLEEEQPEMTDQPQVRSAQWIAYERRLYERYLEMVSQSVDLILQTILAGWMALLLDDDSDHCFGSSSSDPRLKSQSDFRAHPKEDPVYNYNGVRYSIRPDTRADSPNRVVVR